MSSASVDSLCTEIEKRLARKKHSDLLRVIMEALKEGGEEGVKKEIKSRLLRILEE